MGEKVDEAVTLKEKGNEAFKNGLWEEAVQYYSKAISIGEKHNELPVVYRNRAAAYLKLKHFEQAAEDCSHTLESIPHDPKASFRRRQAYEALERIEEAYKDGVDLLKADPSNKAIHPILEKLHAIVQEQALVNSQTSTKVQKMCNLAFDVSNPEDKRKSAMNNLLVLSREPVGAEYICKEGAVQKIAQLAKTEKNQEIYLNAIRTVGELCNKNVQRTKLVLRELGVPWFLQILDSKSQDQVNAAQFCLQSILNTFSGMENKLDSKPVKELCDKYQKEIDNRSNHLWTCKRRYH